MNKIKKIITDVPTDGVAFLSFWQNELAQIPVAYLSTVKIEYEAEQSYDLHYVEACISYSRPFTEEELSEHARLQKEAYAIKEAAEYTQFLRLKEKFKC